MCLDNHLIFPKSRRISNHRDYRKVRLKGLKVAGKHITIRYRQAKGSKSRLGISASKKFGKAHQRNRFKRISKEAFRLKYPDLPKGLDIVIYPRRQALNARTPDIIDDLEALIAPHEVCVDQSLVEDTRRIDLP